VEALARRLFSNGSARRVIAIELPKSRSAMHLDTMLTMIDVQTFVAYPYLDDATIRHWVVTPDAHGSIDVEARSGLTATLAEALARDDIRILKAVEDPKEAEREQWNDADNFLAVAPGVVLGYERNVVTNGMLESHGIEVVPLHGNELGRGRGGARCMSCPIQRDPISERPTSQEIP
jgi:arginine deiminase